MRVLELRFGDVAIANGMELSRQLDSMYRIQENHKRFIDLFCSPALVIGNLRQRIPANPSLTSIRTISAPQIRP